MTPAPIVLETSRLLLRPHRLDDFADMLRLWSNPDVTRFIAGNRPLTREEVWQRLLRYAGLWPLFGFGYFAIADRQTGAFIGEAGLADFHRDILPSMDGLAEAGWALLPDHWGNGLAAEALGAILSWYATTPDPRPVACIINPENAVSIRLARKIGFRARAQTEYNGSPCLMMAYE
jgi:RimJ/RimL family protein N-acetyltransferase